MTVDDLLDGLLAREGGFVNLPADRGGPTKFGITGATLGAWRGLGRSATVAEVAALEADEARAIYRREYVQPFEAVPFEALRAQLVDFGVTSGVETAVRTLQRVLGVAQDGVIGDRTRAALVAYPWRLTNDSVAAARIKLLSDLAETDPTQRGFLRGWVARAVAFLA